MPKNIGTTHSYGQDYCESQSSFQGHSHSRNSHNLRQVLCYLILAAVVGAGSDAPVPFANKTLVEVDRHRNTSYLARNVLDRKQQ